MPRINYELGGLIASAYPEGYDNMRLAWDLMSGEVFFPNGQTLARNVNTRATFKLTAEGFFAKVFEEEVI